MKPLLDALTPKARRLGVYVPLGVIGTALGAFGLGWAAVSDSGLPDWYVAASVVYPFIAGAFGFNLATANVPSAPIE